MDKSDFALEKGVGGWTKMTLRCGFLADQKIASSWKKCLGHPIARATSCCLLPDTF